MDADLLLDGVRDGQRDVDGVRVVVREPVADFVTERVEVALGVGEAGGG